MATSATASTGVSPGNECSAVQENYLNHRPAIANNELMRLKVCRGACTHVPGTRHAHVSNASCTFAPPTVAGPYNVEQCRLHAKQILKHAAQSAYVLHGPLFT